MRLELAMQFLDEHDECQFSVFPTPVQVVN